MNTSRSRPSALKRAYRLVALVASLLFAGTGHAMIGRWKRGLAWFGLYVVSLTLLSGYWAAETSGLFITSVLKATLPPDEIVFPLSVLVLCLVDLYALTTARRRHDDRANRV